MNVPVNLAYMVHVTTNLAYICATVMRDTAGSTVMLVGRCS